MIAFISAVLRLLDCTPDGWEVSARRRQIEVKEMAEALTAHACAVLLLAGAMTGLASVIVHVIRIVQAYGGGS